MRKLFFLSVFLLIGFLFGGVYYTGFFVGKLSTGDLNANIDEGVHVIDYNFRGQGESTDFLHMSDLELSGAIGLALEREEFGKIYFPGKTNLLADAVNNTIDLDSNVDISYNHCYINCTNLNSLNKSAIINFYDISFREPIILKNGEVCATSECEELSYVNGEFIFNVSSADAEYSLREGYVQEEEEETSSPSDSGGGGGAGVSGPTYSFEIVGDYMLVRLFSGENSSQTIRIRNTGSEQLVFEIKKSESLDRFLYFENNRLVIEPGEEGFFPLIFYSRSNQKADVYLGTFEISSAGRVEIVDVLVEVLEREPIFDVFVEAEEKVSLGRSVEANIDVINMGNLENFDLLLYYSVRDFSGEVIAYKEESIFMKKELHLEKELSFPKYNSGRYVFYVNASYGDIYAIGSDSFLVIENKYFLILILLVLTLISLTGYLLWPRIKRIPFVKSYLSGRKKIKHLTYTGRR